MRRLFLAMLAIPTAAQAEPPVVLSPAPDSVAVTLYRDPDRSIDAQIDRDSPSSFALIAETRTVTLPPGETIVRFEGVASGIVPQSAILFGTDPRERNRDAALLSQKGLVDAFTGQHVILRRTDPATGETIEESATIRSAADRLVVSTPRGVEAVYCSGLNQTLIYPEAPATLSAKPVLSMRTKDQPGGTVTITLAYIATGFDWNATYVGTLAPDGKSMALLGWMTMASGDDTSFIDATTSAVAGKINRSAETQDGEGQQIRNEAARLNKTYQCWPAGRTSDVAYGGQIPPLGAPIALRMAMAGDDIVVTARRREERLQDAPMSVSVVAKAENLGDLKLYRIPVPVTVAARSQKQVAFMVKDRVKGEVIYRSRVDEDLLEPEKLFRFHNRKEDGTGDPLPAGTAVLYQMGSLGRGLIGESSTPDKAVDEDVELVFGEADGVTVETEMPKNDEHARVTTIRNANPFAVLFEAEFFDGSYYRYPKLPGGLIRKPGKRVWRTTIPANDAVRLTYRVDAGDAN
ncbi:MAG TPA: hypothetical protein VF481_20355 [Novosphingobium sp.]